MCVYIAAPSAYRAMAAEAQPASLLPDRLLSLRGFVVEQLLNDGAENGSVNGERHFVTS